MKITYLKGDATCPQAKGHKIIVHVCNDLGGWGKGFVLALSKRWPEPEKDYRLWHRKRSENDFALGAVRFVEVEKWISVANMIAQRGIKPSSAGPPIRYESVEQCLTEVATTALNSEASVHMPRIGCGLAGGKWSKIEPILEDTLVRRNVSVVVYDF